MEGKKIMDNSLFIYSSNELNSLPFVSSFVDQGVVIPVDKVKEIRKIAYLSTPVSLDARVFYDDDGILLGGGKIAF